MTSAPKEPIVIDDLAAPRFTPEVTAVRARLGAQKSSRPLTVEHLMETAADRERLDDFGSHDFIEPLTVLCESYRGQVALSDPGAVAMHASFVQLLRNRLRLEYRLREQPD